MAPLHQLECAANAPNRRALPANRVGQLFVFNIGFSDNGRSLSSCHGITDVASQFNWTRNASKWTRMVPTTNKTLSSTAIDIGRSAVVAWNSRLHRAPIRLAVGSPTTAVEDPLYAQSDGAVYAIPP